MTTTTRSTKNVQTVSSLDHRGFRQSATFLSNSDFDAFEEPANALPIEGPNRPNRVTMGKNPPWSWWWMLDVLRMGFRHPISRPGTPDHQKRLWPSCYQVPIFPAVFLHFKDPSQWFILRIWNSPLIHGIGSMSNVHPISGQNYIHSTLVASLCLMFNPHSCLLNPPFWGQTYIT